MSKVKLLVLCFMGAPVLVSSWSWWLSVPWASWVRCSILSLWSQSPLLFLFSFFFPLVNILIIGFSVHLNDPNLLMIQSLNYFCKVFINEVTFIASESLGMDIQFEGATIQSIIVTERVKEL